jgi:hypothetical protein
VLLILVLTIDKLNIEAASKNPVLAKFFLISMLEAAIEKQIMMLMMFGQVKNAVRRDLFFFNIR